MSVKDGDLMSVDFPGIISAAAGSPLGVLSLCCLALGLIAVFFFRDASEKARLFVFILLLVSVVGSAAAVYVQSVRAVQSAAVAPATLPSPAVPSKPMAQTTKQSDAALIGQKVAAETQPPPRPSTGSARVLNQTSPRPPTISASFPSSVKKRDTVLSPLRTNGKPIQDILLADVWCFADAGGKCGETDSFYRFRLIGKNIHLTKLSPGAIVNGRRNPDSYFRDDEDYGEIKSISNDLIKLSKQNGFDKRTFRRKGRSGMDLILNSNNVDVIMHHGKVDTGA